MVIFLGLVREAVKIGSGVCGKEGDKDDSDGGSDDRFTGKGDQPQLRWGGCEALIKCC